MCVHLFVCVNPPETISGSNSSSDHRLCRYSVRVWASRKEMEHRGEKCECVCVWCGREGRASLCLYLSHHSGQLSRGDTKVSVSAPLLLITPALPLNPPSLLSFALSLSSLSSPVSPSLSLSLSLSLAVLLCTAQWQMEAVSAGRNGHSHTPYTHSPSLFLSLALSGWNILDDTDSW